MAGHGLTVRTCDFLFQCNALALCSVITSHVSDVTNKRQLKPQVKPDLTKIYIIFKINIFCQGQSFKESFSPAKGYSTFNKNLFQFRFEFIILHVFYHSASHTSTAATLDCCQSCIEHSTDVAYLTYSIILNFIPCSLGASPCFIYL